MKNGWRDAVAERLDARHIHSGPTTHDNRALGGSSTSLACGLSEFFFVDFSADLVFIEYSAADSLLRNDRVAMRAAERFLRTILRLAPEADIVLLHTFIELHGVPGQNAWAADPVLEHYERLAHHYGCPSINLSRHLYNLIDGGAYSYTDGDIDTRLFRRDGRHMSLLGVELAAEFICRSLDEIGETSPMSSPVPRSLPAPLLDEREVGELVPAIDPAWLYGNPVLCFGKALGTAVPPRQEFWRLGRSAWLEFELRGALAGLTVISNFHSGVVSIEIGESVHHASLFRREHQHVAHASFVSIEDNFDPDTRSWRRVRIKLADKIIDAVRSEEATFTTPRADPADWELNLVCLNIYGDARPAPVAARSAGQSLSAQRARSRLSFVLASPLRYARQAVTELLPIAWKDRIFHWWMRRFEH